MRITKVKVKNQPVEIYRTPEEGKLVLKDKKEENRSREILESKSDSFFLSIKNQTVNKSVNKILKEKYDNIDEFKFANKNLKKKRDNISKFVDQLAKFGNSKYNLVKGVSFEEINLCLKPKFTNPITYVDENGESHTFTFSQDLIQYIQTKDKKKLENYQSWVQWYIKNKTHWIVKSIEHNKIALEGDEKQSKRKKALSDWEEDYHQHTFNLNDFHKRYCLNEFVTRMQTLRENVSEEDQTLNPYEFHQSLKKALQEHQKKIFGTRETYKEGHPDYEMYKKNREDVQLATYHLEMVKYIAHYFPLKSIKRKNTKEDVDYYFKEETIQGALKNQLLNALRLYIIQKKKAETQHWKDISIDSDKLSAFKRRDFFMLKLFNYVAFAANNVRNIVDRDLEGDVLYGETFFPKLEDGKIKEIKTNLLESFYQPLTEDDKQEMRDILSALRASVQKIRNGITHNKKRTIEEVKVFDKIVFQNELKSDVNKPYASVNYFRNAFAKEIQMIPTYFKEAFSSNQITAFYSCDDIKKLFEKCHFSLHRIPVPHVPGFKKVRMMGAKYQNPEKETYDLELTSYIKEVSIGSEAYQAYYFLLKLIYNHAFLNSFLSGDNRAFRTASNFVYKKNKEHADNKNKKREFAFNGFRRMFYNELPSDYLKEMQSAAVQEQIKKEKAEQKGAQEGRMNYEKYVQQIFVKGFDSYLKKHEMDFITYPNQVKETNTEEGLLDEFIHQGIIQHALKSDNSQHIGVFIFCKLLDASMLSSLRNELIKLRETNPKRYEENHQFKYNFVLEIIELCLLSADRVVTTTNVDVVSNKTFFEIGTTPHVWDDLYKQTDNVTNVAHANIQLVYKYGTLRLLEEIASKYPVKHNEYLEWRRIKNEIAKKTIERSKLHIEIVNSKKETKDTKDTSKYKQLCLEIERYNWLDNKLHLVHIRRLHELMLEILSRMASYVALWARDIEDTKVLSSEETKEKRDTRNYIAHFNYISSGASKSILELLAGLRNLMDYDRKLKNAVSKSLITIFEKHGMELDLDLDKHTHAYTVKTVDPKEMKHLKGRVLIPQVSEEYCQLCRALLEYKSN